MSKAAALGAIATIVLLLAGCAHREATPVPITAAPVEPGPPPQSFAFALGDASIGTAAVYVTQPDDTLLDIARQYDLGFTQLMIANPGLDPWRPGTGRNITLPAAYLLPDGARRGIVINLAEQRLFYFPPDGASVETFPIGVGVQGRATPLGVTKVTRKDTNPVWRVPASIRAEDPDLPAVVEPGPDNPLGDYAFSLGWPSYLIHGTNKPYGIGRNVSHGCIHLYPEDIARLFGEVPIGTPVRVIDQEVETAWIGGDLYVAVFPTKDQAEAIDTNQPIAPSSPPSLVRQVKAASVGHARQIDWQMVQAAGRDRTGMPVRVTLPEVASGS